MKHYVFLQDSFIYNAFKLCQFFFFLLIHSTRCDRQTEASTVNALFYHIAIHCAEYFVIKTKKIDS